jgi:hypothetical protein
VSEITVGRIALQSSDVRELRDRFIQKPETRFRSHMKAIQPDSPERDLLRRIAKAGKQKDFDLIVALAEEAGFLVDGAA